jgi:hypothetical protein
MPTTIGFLTVQAYLDALADLNGALNDSPHKAFWKVSYDAFIAGKVPGVLCQGAAVPIINKDAPEQSPFYLILTDPSGWCGKRQMPGGGPFITDDDLDIPLADGTIVKGKQVRDDLAAWLQHGYPKEPQGTP